MADQDQPPLSTALTGAKPRPTAEVLRLYTPYYEELLCYNASNREFIEQRDAPAECFRWLVELDCGCVTDALTTGHLAAHVPMVELYPGKCVFQRMLGSRESGASQDNVLLFGWGVTWKYSNWREGYAWCSGHGNETPVREITDWLEREERPGHYSAHLGQQVGPYAKWVVKFSCGHYCHHAISEVDWRPEHGYTKRTDFMTKIRHKLASEDLDEKTRQTLEQTLATCGTEPQSRDDCPVCAYTRRIVGNRPVGPLARPKPPPKPRKAQAPPSRRTLTRRLHTAEASVSSLREQLAQAEQRAARLRDERDQAGR
jgi:hypothetical protein